MNTWPDGTIKSINNAFTSAPVRTTLKRDSQHKNRFRLTTKEQAICSFLSRDESIKFRNEIRKQRGLL